jgi:hypothetical protein
MEYSLDLLYKEKERIQKEFDIAINKEPKDWDVIVPSERLLQDLQKTIELIEQNQY